jgi:hypothetical protein
MIQVPDVPEDERIESMCMRYDHSHGIKNLVVDSELRRMRMENDAEFARRQETNRRLMRQLYEEATGQGFFRVNP